MFALINDYYIFYVTNYQSTIKRIEQLSNSFCKLKSTLFITKLIKSIYIETALYKEYEYHCLCTMVSL